MSALAKSVHEFNVWTKNHPNLDIVILPLRDGLSIMTYNAPKLN